MRTTTLLALMLSGALLLAAGCGGDGKRTDTSTDSGGTTPQDSGNTTPQDSGNTTPQDSGNTTPQDSSAAAPETCGDILDCSYGCSDDNWDACEQSCMAQSDEGTKQLYTTVIDCEDAAYESTCGTICSGSDGAACDACFITACGEQYKACYGLPPASPGSCTEILNCTFMCSEDSYDACAQGCVSQGNANAQQLFTTLDQCWNAASTASCSADCSGSDMDACYACTDSVCAAELSACVGDA